MPRHRLPFGSAPAIATLALAVALVSAADPLAAQAPGSWRGEATLGVEVRGEDRDPIEGARITVIRLVGAEQSIEGLTTGGDGRVGVGGLAPGPWLVVVDVDGYMQYRTTVELRESRKPKPASSALQAVGPGGATRTLRVDFFEAEDAPTPKLAAAPPTGASAGTRGEASTSQPVSEPAATPDRKARAPEHTTTPEGEAEGEEAGGDVELETASGEAASETTVERGPETAEPAPEPAGAREQAPEPDAVMEPTDDEIPPPPAPEERESAPPDDSPPSPPEPITERPRASAEETPDRTAPKTEGESADAVATDASPGRAERVNGPVLVTGDVRTPRPRTGSQACPDCRPGEWALDVNGTVEPSGPDVDEADCREAFTDGELPPPGGAVSAGAAVLGNLGAGGCAVLSVALPPDARMRGFRLAADGQDCLPDRGCPVGDARWIAGPELREAPPRGTTVWALFYNASETTPREATLTVYYAPPDPPARP